MTNQVTPKKTDTRKEVFQFRLNLAERQKLDKLASARHMAVAAYVRAASLGELAAR